MSGQFPYIDQWAFSKSTTLCGTVEGTLSKCKSNRGCRKHHLAFLYFLSFCNVHQKSIVEDVNKILIGSLIGNKQKAFRDPAEPTSPVNIFFPSAVAAVIENKQSLASTLHRDCGINNSSLGFMTNASGLSAPFTISEALSTFFMCAIMYDSLVFTHNTQRRVLVRLCLTLVITSCQRIPVVHDGWRDHKDNVSAFHQRKDPSTWQRLVLTSAEPWKH